MKHERKIMLNVVILVIAFGMAGVAKSAPMGTAFTYQGRLTDANSPADGLYDFEFEVYDSADGGSQEGSTVDVNDLDVIDGYFTVPLDFGSDIFTGDARWLQVAVRPGASSNPCDFAQLSPRQELTPTPYAMYSGQSGDADTLDSFDSSAFASIGHHHDSDYALISHIHDDRYYTETELQSSGSSSVHWDNLTSVPAGLGDGDDNTQLTEGQVDTYVANNGYLDGASALDWDNITIDMPAGFADDVDNTGDSDWTISGSDMYTGAGVTGNVGIGTSGPSDKLDVDGHINSTESYKLDGQTVVSDTGIANILVGNYAGDSITTGGFNSAMGQSALRFNTEGNYNTAMGAHALTSNTTGDNNSAMGYQALRDNTGSNNSAMGYRSLIYNTGGFYNSAMGYSALYANTTGYHNVGLGAWANYYNREGSQNTIIGYEAGHGSGLHNKSGNVFLGYKAGYNETGDNKLYIANSDVNPPLIYGEFDTGNVGIGTTEPNATLTVAGAILRNGSTMYGTNAYTHINLGTTSTAGTNGQNYSYATVGGGKFNTASGWYTTVGGGSSNSASNHWATVGGGYNNTASGYSAIVPGGEQNVAGGKYSFAAGYRAKVRDAAASGDSDGDEGTFVWADYSTDSDFQSTGRAQFLIRASGGVGINTNSPAYDLDVSGDIRAIGSVYYGGTVGNSDGTAYSKPDYVFEYGYDVMSIEQVEEYLKEENHLPWMTSAKAEKQENGDVIDMTRMAFETVETAENLQIQIIEQNKLIKELKTQNELLNQRLSALESMMTREPVSLAREVQ